MAIDARTLILEYICPGIGVALATLMFLAPYKDVQKAIKAGSLGELNPLPWVFMLGNCTGWILYSFLRRVSVTLVEPNKHICLHHLTEASGCAPSPGFFLVCW
jgi:uncharacterized protein with PQ loop repeat